MKKLLLTLLMWCGLAQGAAPVPNTFATMPAGNVAASTLDTNFALIAHLNTFSNYYVDSGAANVYVVTPAAGTTVTYNAGLMIQFAAAHTNTGASTINVNALGAKNILNPDGSSLAAGQITANGAYTIIYDGTQFQLLGNAQKLKVKVGAATHDISVTGTQTVSGLGFTPVGVIVFQNIQSVAGVVSIGFSDGTNQYMTGTPTTNAADNIWYSTNWLVYDRIDVSNEAYAVIGAFSSGQFTLTWAKAGSPTGTASMIYLVFGY